MADNTSLRILVADRDPRVRAALQTLLLQMSASIAIHECGDIGSLVGQARGFQPHLVLLDWDLICHPAAALLYALQELETRPTVIVLSTRPESEEEALIAGAEAFVSKVDPPDQLLRVIHKLVRMPAGEEPGT